MVGILRVNALPHFNNFFKANLSAMTVESVKADTSGAVETIGGPQFQAVESTSRGSYEIIRQTFQCVTADSGSVDVTGKLEIVGSRPGNPAYMLPSGFSNTKKITCEGDDCDDEDDGTGVSPGSGPCSGMMPGS